MFLLSPAALGWLGGEPETLCTNTCNTASSGRRSLAVPAVEGVCQDGGPGSPAHIFWWKPCDYGTDCDDCAEGDLCGYGTDCADCGERRAARPWYEQARDRIREQAAKDTADTQAALATLKERLHLKELMKFVAVLFGCWVLYGLYFTWSFFSEDFAPGKGAPAELGAREAEIAQLRKRAEELGVDVMPREAMKRLIAEHLESASSGRPRSAVELAEALAGWNSLTAGLSLDRSGKPTEAEEEAGGDGEDGGLEHGGFESLHDTARPPSVSSRIPSVRQHTKTVQRLMEGFEIQVNLRRPGVAEGLEVDDSLGQAFVPSGRPCPPVYQRLATSELLPSRSNRSSMRSAERRRA
ncbi:hypothetical protein EMIHUDRAFT_455148 [Emiliania huxleyi CCMP1516]|uniref:Uncharacterized protein n=2 Tax=Emiliania huxleyi TaxID=2903 RepID=A0A0D3KK76_EMIH1|nr:hypothetical protein EMIHUDRAFT_455148 [Emiliania huxleyi CCMP1516]EOD36161.1 hypothetical protein EMIHUDRAFT_455148 [Emiliania huxleyi CCMP1516]|eukprot:XP_005788590.1 hypothetical protein EMIHUDRAFT_455148 [Emiliania huxleyi CCMP1516]